MKRKSLRYNDPRYVISSENKTEKLEAAGAAVWLSLTEVTEVSHPQILHFNGNDLTICDKGRKRFSILPSSDHYCITATLRKDGSVVLWYIDIIAAQDVDNSGIPYFDDLYLDLIVTPDGFVWVDDWDELDAAYQNGEITQELYDLAITACEKLHAELTASISRLEDMTQQYYRYLSDMHFQWKSYTPADAALVDAWLDAEAIRETGIDEGWQTFYDFWMTEHPAEDSRDYCYLVLEKECAFAVIYTSLTNGVLTVSELIVAPEKRGHGLGSALLTELIENADLLLGTVPTAVHAVIFPDNIASQKAFARAGFVLASKHPDGDAWYYEKILSSCDHTDDQPV